MSVVMLVEDEAILRMSMAQALERLPDLQVVQAGTLDEARRMFAEEAPSMIVSDISLPDGCGVDLLADIEAAARPVPVIFVSAWLGQFRERIPTRDDIEIFEKPMPMEMLRRKVLHHLEARRNEAPAPFGVVDYLQLAAMGGRSLMLRLKMDRGQMGWLRLYRGELWDAHYLELTGEAAAEAAVLAQDLRVELEPWPGAPGERRIHTAVDALLLDAFRRHDELTHPLTPSRIREAAQQTPRPEDPQPQAAARPKISPPPLPDLSSTRPPLPPLPAIPLASGPTHAAHDKAEDSFDEDLLTELAPDLEALAPTLTPPQAQALTPEPTAAEDAPPADVDLLLDAGLDALLSKDYPRAWILFSEANRLRPNDPVITANLTRMKEMGIA